MQDESSSLFSLDHTKLRPAGCLPTRLHGGISPEGPRPETSRSVPSILPDYAHSQRDQHSLCWVWDDMKELHPVATASTSPTTKVGESALLQGMFPEPRFRQTIDSNCTAQATPSTTPIEEARHDTLAPSLPEKPAQHRSCALSVEAHNGLHVMEGVQQGKSNHGNRSCSAGGWAMPCEAGFGIADQKPTKEESRKQSVWGERGMQREMMKILAWGQY